MNSIYLFITTVRFSPKKIRHTIIISFLPKGDVYYAYIYYIEKYLSWKETPFPFQDEKPIKVGKWYLFC